jgi:hypothetical protein
MHVTSNVLVLTVSYCPLTHYSPLFPSCLRFAIPPSNSACTILVAVTAITTYDTHIANADCPTSCRTAIVSVSVTSNAYNTHSACTDNHTSCRAVIITIAVSVTSNSISNHNPTHDTHAESIADILPACQHALADYSTVICTVISTFK